MKQIQICNIKNLNIIVELIPKVSYMHYNTLLVNG